MNVDRHPDFKGCLSPNPVKLEDGEQTNYPMFYSLTGNGKTMMFGEGGIDIGITVPSWENCTLRLGSLRGKLFKPDDFSPKL